MVGHSPHEHDSLVRARRANRAGRWVFWAFALIAIYFLWTEHRAHVVGFLPYALLLACLLLHRFHRHGGDGGHNNKQGKTR